MINPNTPEAIQLRAFIYLALETPMWERDLMPLLRAGFPGLRVANAHCVRDFMQAMSNATMLEASHKGFSRGRRKPDEATRLIQAQAEKEPAR
jgi:hypothetical protein